MYAQTVEEPVDRHVAPLVDAINRTGEATTYSSCSGHLGRSDFPFVAFRTRRWAFVGRMRRSVTELNEVTHGQTLLEIAPFDDDGATSAVTRFRMYPWLWAPDINLAPLAAQLVPPPPRLVRLWWAEVAALATILRTGSGPSRAAEQFFDVQRRSLRGFPRWGTHGVSLGRG